MRDVTPEGFPLCVDLDGTLIQNDSCWLAFFLLLKRNPLAIFLCGLWSLRGFAYLKYRISERVDIDPRRLPYARAFLDFLHAEAAAGRPIVLVTAAPRRTALRIADALGLFSEVIASDDVHNIKGAAKRAALDERFGRGGYDYAGNAGVDFAVWCGARGAIVVNPSRWTLRRARRLPNLVRIFYRGATA